mgnify:CR=1 FL=1
MSEIALRNVCKQFDSEHYGVKDFNLDIHDKEFVIFVGPSGCGKSTTLRIIAGLEEITDGELWIDGELSNYLEPKERGMSMVFQNYAIFPNLSVRDNVAFGLKNRKVDKAEIKKRTDEFLNLMQIMQYADRMPNQLSGGQQQRVSIARALARGPAVILADEPTGALDSHTSREVLGMLQDLHKQGNTVVLITHDNSIAVQAERIIRLEDGRVVYDGDAHAPEAVVQPNFMMAEPKAGEEGTQA